MRSLNILLAGWICVSAPLSAQVTVSSLTEIQRGEVPGADTTAVSTSYNQLNIDFSQKMWQVGLRAEGYEAWGTNRQVYQITQKYARWNHRGFRLELGNYNAILGRGLTLRAYELPGVILESQSYRLRYSPIQDMEGAYGAWTGRFLEAKALIGKPAQGDIPPGATTGNPPRNIERRGNWVAGTEVSIQPVQQILLGATAIRIDPDSLSQNEGNAWSGYADLDLSRLTRSLGLYGSFYGEYARRFGDTVPRGSGWLASIPHGLYLSGNLGNDRVGLSAEYKDYVDMALCFNDPPSLIREHTAFLLNRATHVLLATNEKGYQAEATYTQPNFGSATANITYARNVLLSTPDTTIARVFKERHLAISLDRFDNLPIGVFFNWGKDALAGISRRRIAGISGEKKTSVGQLLGFDLQHQRASRPFGTPRNFTDTFGLLSWQHPKGYGGAVIMDRTTDPFEVDRAETSAIETGNRIFWSVQFNARFSPSYNLVLFLGERRGGTACTSGTCYQVLPFQGLEMRLNTSF
jgi:hypothetical protein